MGKCKDCQKELTETNKANEETCLSCHENWAENQDWIAGENGYEE